MSDGAESLRKAARRVFWEAKQIEIAQSEARARVLHEVIEYFKKSKDWPNSTKTHIEVSFEHCISNHDGDLASLLQEEIDIENWHKQNGYYLSRRIPIDWMILEGIVSCLEEIAKRYLDDMRNGAIPEGLEEHRKNVWLSQRRTASAFYSAAELIRNFTGDHVSDDDDDPSWPDKYIRNKDECIAEAINTDSIAWDLDRARILPRNEEAA